MKHLIFNSQDEVHDKEGGIAKNLLNSIFLSILNRAFILFNIISLFLLFLYFLGNFQNFLDSTQVFILQLLEYSVLIAGLLGAYNLAVLIIITMKKGQPNFFRFFLLIISIIINFTLFLSLKFLFSWLKL